MYNCLFQIFMMSYQGLNNCFQIKITSCEDAENVKGQNIREEKVSLS